MDQTFEDPQVRHLDMANTLRHPKLGDIKIMGPAVNFSRSHHGELRPAPEQGEHNLAIFSTLGLSESDLAALKAEGVI
jgi:crotonobetainyl-CoA:carnitine CoA-transferase CaiB-like acyl-CoA transferase